MQPDIVAVAQATDNLYKKLAEGNTANDPSLDELDNATLDFLASRAAHALYVKLDAVREKILGTETTLPNALHNFRLLDYNDIDHALQLNPDFSRENEIGSAITARLQKEGICLNIEQMGLDLTLSQPRAEDPRCHCFYLS